MTQKHDPYPELTLGTILKISDPRSDESHYAMRLANGEWWEVFASKTPSGQTIYIFGAKAIDPKLMKASDKLEAMVNGIQVGDTIATGIQIMALPLDAVAIHLNGGKYVKTTEGMINDQGRSIPYSQVMPGTHVWAA